MKNALLALMLFALLSACDIHKDERYAEQAKLESLAADTEKLRGRLEDVERKISKTEIEVKEAREDQKANESEYEKNKLELAKYAMDHKLASVAAAMGAGGIAALFSDLDQEQKAAITAPTAIALGYCLFNGEECSEVATRIAYYGTQIALFKSRVSEAQKREASAREVISASELERQSLKSGLADQSAKLVTLREHIKSLECPFPVCF